MSTQKCVSAILAGPFFGRAHLAVLDAARTDQTDVALIAVDRGIDCLHDQDIRPTLAVGDFDSVSAEGLAWAQHLTPPAELVQVAREKDFSDLDLALRLCCERGSRDLLLLGFIGGRLDHQMAVCGVCARYAAHATIRIIEGVQKVSFFAAGQSCVVETGTCFSVIALTDPTLVSISGAQYRLDHSRIAPLSDRGLSNRALRDCNVSVHEGLIALFTQSSQPLV